MPKNRPDRPRADVYANRATRDDVIRFIDRVSKVSLTLVTVVLLGVVVFAIANSDAYLARPTLVLAYLVLPAALASLCALALLRGRARSRARLSVCLLSVVLGAYVAELGLEMTTPSPLGRSLAHLKAAEDLNVPYDDRSLLEVTRSLRAEGIPAVPSVSPMQFVSNPSVASEVFGGGPVKLAFAGVSNRPTVFCNESGQFVVYDSDEHGFNNAKGIWNERNVDMALLGDSYVQGACVPREKNIAGQLEASGRRVANLGMSWSGPLQVLANLREYARPLRPRNVVWYFFEGNDFVDLEKEKRSPVLTDYLNGGTQDLLEKQPEIDRRLSSFLDTLVERPEAKSNFSLSGLISLSYLRRALVGEINRPPALDLSLLDRVLREAKEEVGAWGGTLHFVYLPAWERYQDGGRVSSDREKVLSLAERLGVPTVDIHEEFEKLDDPDTAFALQTRGHYNEMGYRIVAEATLEATAP